MSLFGDGRMAAAALRGRILELIGAEPEWTEGDHDCAEMRWTSGPVTTFFTVEPGAEATPDLGVLRVTSLVATVGDRGLGLAQCQVLNMGAMTHRWTIAPTGLDPDTEVLQVSCSFVVGQHNAASLEAFALWCVREQIAIATAKLTNNIAGDIGGVPVHIPGHQGGDYRNDPDDWHEVVYHYDRVVTPNQDLPAAPLRAGLARAFERIQQEMFDEGTGAWHGGADATGFLCEMPFSWKPYPGGMIGDGSTFIDAPPTVLVAGTAESHPHAGHGLLLKMRLPAGPGDDAGELANRLNLCDRSVPGATHSVGAWVESSGQLMYWIYLPAVLAEQQGIDPAAVVREMLLTLVRQALLARRILLDDEDLMDEDRYGAVGLAAPSVRHRLAWGETGEGRNPSAWYLDGIYRLLVGDDAEWAYPAPQGFRWWPYQQAQEISVVHSGDDSVGIETVRVRVATDVRANVAATPAALTAIAQRNATLADSALVLREDGVLVLACQLVVAEDLSSRAHEWVQDLAIRQFVTARELASELLALGHDAASAHPVSGPRRDPDWWFGQFADEMRQAAGDGPGDMPASHPRVALAAAGGQHALPYRMTARDDGALEFSWRPGHTPYAVPSSPEIRVTVTPGGDGAGPAWIIRSHMPVVGEDADKARWCNERNADLLLSPTPQVELMVFGGWGLTPEGECCLTIGQTRRLVRDGEAVAARLLGYLMREEQIAVILALQATPESVHEVPLTTEELAAGLDSVRSAFGHAFGEAPELAWTTKPAAASVQVTCGETDIEVPIGYGRPQLALVYGELLVHCPDGHPWQSLYPLIPGRVADLAFEELERDGVIWQDETGNWVFDAGRALARLELTRIGQSLRVDGIADFLAADRIGALPAGPGAGRLGSTIPPAQFAWPMDYAAIEVLGWTVRHVIDQVREAARQEGQSRKRPLPERPRLFGSGRYAAAALRGRLLELLGAEPEWMLGDHDSPDIVWSSGPATTVFEVGDGSAATPDLGVLRVYTPVATAGNGNAARDLCMELNRFTATARWSVARDSDQYGRDYDEVQVSCAFVIGPHNQDTLESFALWCVREQIAVATAHIRAGDVAGAGAGAHSRYGGFPAGDERTDWHPVTSFAERVVQPSASLSADVLAEELLAAFRELRQDMFDERTSAWFASHDGLPLTFETPFSWDPYPRGVITHMRISDDDPEDKPGTALLESVPVEHPQLGNGLRIAVNVPRDPRGHAGQAINTLNRLDAEVTGTSHSFGGWAVTKTSAGDEAPGCVIFLPAAFAESVANRPLVMREILLTLARQALLARRVLQPPEQRCAEDRDPSLGLAIAADPLAPFVRGPRGLAWGETGEGRNPAARVLDQIYSKCVGPDADWADTRADGFRWWPYHQAQDVTATLRSASSVAQGVSVRIATQVRRHVPVTAETLRVIAAMNAELGQSALVLGDDGALFLACRLYVHEGIDHWANEWAKNLAAEQFILARDISSRLAERGGFGEDAVSGHPFSGMRPEPDELFGIRENSLIPDASDVQAGMSPLVPLLGLCPLYMLPLSVRMADSGGGLDFTWRLSQARGEPPVDAVVRVSVRRGDVGSGPGWIVRSFLPVTGDEAVWTRWCNDRNADLLADGDGNGDDRTVVGGWGVTPDGECCLTTWLSPFFVPDAIPQAAGLIGNVLSYQAGAVLSAVAADPASVTGAPALTPEDLARGLSSVLAAFAGALEYPAGFRWSVTPGADQVIATLAGPPAGESDINDAALAETSDSALLTALRIPLSSNRAQTGLLLAAFLGRATARVTTFTSELIPGEAWEWDFTWRHIEEGLGSLDGEGLLAWHSSEGAFTFDAGPATAWLRFERLEKFRSYGGTALRLTATLPVVGLPALPQGDDGDTGVLGSWRQDHTGLSYEVTVPPAGMVFGDNYIVEEMLTWVGRHVITHVQHVVQDLEAKGVLPDRAAEDGRLGRAGNADISWHDHGDGMGAIMSGAGLVASFHAQSLVADEFGKSRPPDRREETQRNVEEGAATLATSGQGERELVAWVARKWQDQLDRWWMYGEPVFWCEHIEPDDDEQPLMEWFMHFPMAVACDQCADLVRAALRTGKSATICSSCGRETTEAFFGRTPGLSIIANYELCPACAALFTVT